MVVYHFLRVEADCLASSLCLLFTNECISWLIGIILFFTIIVIIFQFALLIEMLFLAVGILNLGDGSSN